jgi:glutamate decarboxylase
MFTYEVSPLFNIVEEIVFEKMSNLIGWNEYDAIFSPGGNDFILFKILVVIINK